MSFKNTHTPLKPTTKARYQVPMVAGKCGTKTYNLTGDLRNLFVRYFPKHTNREMMTLFGISFSTLQRFKHELGLEHDKRAIIRKQAQMTKKICEANGYYDSLRGRAPSEACIAATKAKRETGWHPLDEVRKDKRRWARLQQRKSEQRKQIMEKERKRVDWGLPQQTKIHLPFVVYDRRRAHIRYTMKKRGYILGNKFDEIDRLNIYYTDSTTRSTIVERHAEKLHFTIKERLNYGNDY